MFSSYLNNTKWHIIVSALCVAAFFVTTMHAVAVDDGTDTTSGGGILPGIVIQVTPELYDVVCENGDGVGYVKIREVPVIGLEYEIEGVGMTTVVTSGSPVRLIAGEYHWHVLADLAVTNVEPLQGVIQIENMCDTQGGNTATDGEETNGDGSDTSTATNDPTDQQSEAEEPDQSIGDAVVQTLLPPETFDVLREGGVTFVLIEGGQNVTSNIYAYRIYRRCDTATSWWAAAKVRIAECGGYACSYQFTDKPAGDTCEYSIVSMDVAGIESSRTPGRVPTETYDTNEEDAGETTDSGSSVGVETDTTTTENVNATDPITTEEVTRHVATGKYIIMLQTDDAVYVEWTMYPEKSKTPTYLGRAVHNKRTGFWEYVWDTTNVPNGDYTLMPEIQSLSGRQYEEVPTYVRVKNAATKTVSEDDKKLVDIVKEAATEVAKVSSETDSEREKKAKEDIVDVLTPYAEEAKGYIEKQGEEAMKNELAEEEERIKQNLTTLLNVESSKLLHALDGDEEEFKRFENKVIIAAQKSTEQIGRIAEEFGFELSEKELRILEEEVVKKLDELEVVIQERREVLKDRVGEDVFEDTDNDGISNYDEVHIYNTDPSNPDTDNDGFFDGAEILGGYNPLSAASEAVVEYEEPRTAGFIEDEIFVVEEVEVIEKKKDTQGVERAEKIQLKGKAPANSFITLYIYSDPIVVTVKTDADGNWVYELDKELEDGSHEVYVAITDNAGRIYAKSRPLPFVKEAAAVTIDEAALFNPEAQQAPSLTGSAYVYIIVLLIVGIIGWALVFTGSRQMKLEKGI
jgi:hypothetical protein